MTIARHSTRLVVGMNSFLIYALSLAAVFAAGWFLGNRKSDGKAGVEIIVGPVSEQSETNKTKGK